MTCEKCWADAYVRTQTLGGIQADHYRELLAERSGDPCHDAPVPGGPPMREGNNPRTGIAWNE